MSLVSTSKTKAVSRLSVLFVLPSLHGGGAERVAVTVLRHLDRRRIDPTLVVLDGSNPAYVDDLPQDVELIDLDCRRVRYSMIPLLRTIWGRRPDTVISMIGHLNLGLALLKPLLPSGLRLYARETNVVSAILAHHPQNLLWRSGYRRLYRRFDAVICQSEQMRAELVEEFGLPVERARIIRNPIDVQLVRKLAAVPLSEQPWRPNVVRLVAVGRLSYEKGLDLLIEALALLDGRSMEVMILGEGPMRPALEARVRQLNLAEKVRFMGFVPNPFQFIARADALILCSRFEAFPNVVLESLACGTPVIATPARGGILEMTSGQRGIAFADDVGSASLARALAEFPFSDDRTSVKADLAPYDVARIAEEYEALLCMEPR